MTINEAFTLINKAEIYQDNGIINWADLGCGNGIFTQALGRMLPAGSVIYGVDKSELLKPGVTNNGVEIITRQFDFITDDLGLKNLDGILMANSLHYVKDKPAFIKKMKTWMKPDGIFLMVEYDTDIPIARWVPYPASYLTLTTLFKNTGYSQVKKLGERPSIYGRANMYSAIFRIK